MWVLVLVTLLITLAYFKIEKVNRHWQEKGIAYIKPWPILGNMASTVFRRRALVNLVDDMYKAYPDKRYVGIYQFMKPTLLIRDIELLKRITVKEFSTFPEHNQFMDPEVDPLWGKNLFSMGIKDGWHDLRLTLSPAFTSSKLKSMFALMQQCSKQLVEHFQNRGGPVSVELKDVFTRLTTDVIGAIAFGVTCDSFRDPDNQFYRMGKAATDFSGIKGLIFFGTAVSPTLMKLLNIKLYNDEVSSFFRGLIKETLKLRKENQLVRSDMIQLLLEARKGRLNCEDQDEVVHAGVADVAEKSEFGRSSKKQIVQLTDDDITAQALIFFLGGFETTSSFLCFVAYELAVHPEIQAKLREEVDATLEECKGQLTYQALMAMKYLNQIISETLRRRPPAGFTDRRSVKPYTIEPEMPGEQPLHLEAGSYIWLPLTAIHMDPKYYPDPEKFDPERFSDKNKHNINPLTYMPFGAGPRSCIGARFALLECKLTIVELLRKFEIVSTEKTPIPIVLTPSNPSPTPEGGFWVGFVPRGTPS